MLHGLGGRIRVGGTGVRGWSDSTEWKNDHLRHAWGSFATGFGVDSPAAPNVFVTELEEAARQGFTLAFHVLRSE